MCENSYGLLNGKWKDCTREKTEYSDIPSPQNKVRQHSGEKQQEIV